MDKGKMMKKRTDNQAHVSTILQQYIDSLKIQSKLDTAALRNVWDNIMGPSVAQSTKDVELKNDVLIVRLDSSVLRHELSFAKLKIAQMVNRHFKRKVVKEVLIY